ncbi:MAG: winged helix-turn-helix transcriptional regulator [Elusimicrobia bacterium]|nr:winged helix-turn-helix transcriptional regulator [Elusimicrobiota bacterium]
MNKTIKILDALSDETRMRIFLLLINGNLCVCELVNILDMKQARISRIMKKLTDSGLTESKRVGKWIIYSVRPETLKMGIVRGLLDDIKISAEDLRRLKNCKTEGIREGCCK